MTPEINNSSDAENERLRQHVQTGLAAINPKLFGSKIKLDETSRLQMDEELDKLIENPYRTPKMLDNVYKKYTGLDVQAFNATEKLPDKPKYTIETQSAIMLGELIISISDKVKQTRFAGVTIKTEYLRFLDLIQKDMDEASMPPEFGRTLSAIDDIDRINQKEAEGLGKLLNQLEKDINAIPSKYR